MRLWLHFELYIDINFSATGTAKTGDATTGFTLGLGTGSTLTMQDVLDSITGATGAAKASITGGKLTINAADTSSNLVIGGTGAAALGLTATATTVRRFAALLRPRPRRLAEAVLCAIGLRPK